MGDYASYKTYGFSATDFYKKFNVNIKGVSEALGVCRETVSKIPVGEVSMESKEKIITYLEDICIEDYEAAVRQYQEDIILAAENLERAWDSYEAKKKILSDYREKYKMQKNEKEIEKYELL